MVTIPEIHPNEDPGDLRAWRTMLPTRDLESHATSTLQRTLTLLDVYGTGAAWSALEVRLDAAPGRTHGTGANLLHIDYVNRATPPPWIALLGVRQDPHNGGATTLASVHEARQSLSEQDRNALSQNVFKYWNDEGAREVGAPLPTFPVLPVKDGYTRFTAKMIPHLDGSATCLSDTALQNTDTIRAAMERFHQALLAHTWRHRLRPGELLVFDQRNFLHGRLAMGEDQDTIPFQERRLLLQAYLRERDPHVDL